MRVPDVCAHRKAQTFALNAVISNCANAWSDLLYLEEGGPGEFDPHRTY